ncbi:MAG: hypothetical protein ACETWB_02310, partial [Anaerolineae bacterium]
AFLERIKDASVHAIFGATVHYNKYLEEGEGCRSLGTVKAKRILSIQYAEKESGKYKYRIEFTDMTDQQFDLPVTDLAFRASCDFLRDRKNLSPAFIQTKAQQFLSSSEVYLRIGLARPFSQMQNRCYLQITGVYSFPDYLKGKNYSDFSVE